MPGQEAVISLLSLLSISRVFEHNCLMLMVMQVSIAPQDNSGWKGTSGGLWSPLRYGVDQVAQGTLSSYCFP